MDSASSVLSAFIKGSNEEFVAPRSCGWVGEPVAVMVKRGHARPTNHTSESSTPRNGSRELDSFPTWETLSSGVLDTTKKQSKRESEIASWFSYWRWSSLL